MNLTEKTKEQINEIILSALGKLVAQGLLPPEPLPPFIVEIPADPVNGDFSCNAALVCAKAFKKNPREIAALIIENAGLDGNVFARLEAAGPGFLNFYLAPDWYSQAVKCRSAKLFSKTAKGFTLKLMPL